MHFRCYVAGARLTHLRQTQQACAKAHLCHFPPVAIKEVFHQWQKGFEIPFDVEIIVDVGLAQGQIAGRHEHLAQRARVLEHQRAARWFPWCGLPGGAIPQAYSNIARRRRAKDVLQ